MSHRWVSLVEAPSTPHIGQIAGGLTVGSTIVIEGHIPSWWTHQFDINLVHGHEPTEDHVRNSAIAIHLNPRFDENAVILNHKEGGAWGDEEREEGDMPVRKGEDFQIMFIVEPESYRVHINGEHYGNFAHRIPYQEVGVLWIDGQVEIRKVEYVQFSYGVPGATPIAYAGQGYAPAPTF
ncbi:Galectin-4 [Halotydeus destructor]|nr:Galectin-4 [Halotydeus destructor]